MGVPSFTGFYLVLHHCGVTKLSGTFTGFDPELLAITKFDPELGWFYRVLLGFTKFYLIVVGNNVSLTVLIFQISMEHGG